MYMGKAHKFWRLFKSGFWPYHVLKGVVLGIEDVKDQFCK
jgi:hypothetical protein